MEDVNAEEEVMMNGFAWVLDAIGKCGKLWAGDEDEETWSANLTVLEKVE